MPKPRRLSRLSLLLVTLILISLLTPAGAFAESLTGSTPCGPYKLDRTSGRFTLSVCGNETILSGTYSGSNITVTQIKAAGFTIKADLAFTAIDPEWKDLMPQLTTLGQGMGKSATLAEELGLDKQSVTELVTSPGGVNLSLACDITDVAMPVHVFKGPVYGNLRVQPGCVALALFPMDLNDLVVEGWLYATADIEAETATIRSLGGIGGTLSTYGRFAAPTLDVNGGSLSADGVTVTTLRATQGSIEAGRSFKAQGSLLGGAGVVQLSAGSRLTAERFVADRLAAEESHLRTGETSIPELVLTKSTMTAGTTTSSTALLNQAALTAGTTSITTAGLKDGALTGGSTRIESVTIQGGSLRAGELTVQSIIASPGSVSAETLTARTGNALVKMTGGPGPADRSGLSGGLIDVTTLDLEKTGVTAGRILTDRLTLKEGSINGGLKVEAGSMLTTDVDVQADQTVELNAATLQMTTGEISAAKLVKINVGQKSDLKAIRVAAPRIEVALAEATVDGASLFTADEGGSGQQMGTFEAGRSVTLESVRPNLTGASYGGYGGSSGDLSLALFNVADTPASNPLTPSPDGGVGGYGMDPKAYRLFKPSPEGGRGGGVIRIGAESLVWDAKATANGGSGSTGLGGAAGGSGGSIILEVKGQLSGSGQLETNGGNGGFRAALFTTAGGGSGGRIRIGYGTLLGDGIKARSLGGRGGGGPDIHDQKVMSWQDWREHGGPGTVFWKPAGKPGTIVIDNTGGPGGVGFIAGDFPEDRVEIKNGLVATTGLKVQGLIIGQGGRLVADQPRLRLHWPPPTAYSGYDEIWANQQYYPTWVVRDRLDRSVRIEAAGDVTVEQGGILDLTGVGGFSRYESLPQPLRGANRAGGSHGGLGGTGRLSSQGRPAPVSGDPNQPVKTGAAGFGDDLDRAKINCGLGGAGGGALRLIVGGSLSVNGRIAADGAPGITVTGCFSSGGTGGGAGGSVWITAVTLRGTGVISASGGSGAFFDGDADGDILGGGGGGGRVAVYGDLRPFTGQILAAGGPGAAGGDVTPDKFQGQAGSVVRVQSPAQGEPPAPGGAPVQPDAVRVTLNGVELKSDVPAHIKAGSTMIPLRALLEALGAEIRFDPATRTISASLESTTLQLVIDSNQAKVNGAVQTLAVAPYILDGRTFVPVRFVSEQLGFTVKWDAGTRTVRITR